ncbi:MAG TPA: response regulator transcription factor [Anaerolineae bacterium]
MTSEPLSPETRRRHILIAEDEANLRELLRISLCQRYDVTAVADGLAAVKAFEANPADMVILDIMMPNLDGFAACVQIRRLSDVPIIMLTALSAVDEIVKGFSLGADDYITKPFAFKELLIRVEAVFRRIDWLQQPPLPHMVLNGELRIDGDNRQVWLSGVEVHLTPIEFQLLNYLAARPGQTVSKEDLFRQVWGYDAGGGTNLVEVGIRRLREKIEPDPSHPTMILTARGTGYKFRTAPRPGQA